MKLPDDHRLHVHLSTYFCASTPAKLRADVLGNRQGWAVVTNWAGAAPGDRDVLMLHLD